MSIVPENYKAWETSVFFHQSKQVDKHIQKIPSISNVTAVRIEEIVIVADDNILPGIYGLRFDTSANNSFAPLFEGTYDRRTFAFCAESVRNEVLVWRPANESSGLLRREQNDVKTIETIAFKLVYIGTPSTMTEVNNVQVMMRLTFLTAGHPINNRSANLNYH